MEIHWFTDKSGCLLQDSHKLNKDGYFRKRILGDLMMYHRYAWEKENGPIPEGYEINHLCKNRGCSNVAHLECISGEAHAILTNKERYKSRQDSAKELWETNPSITGTKLGELYGVSFSAACGWIREWKVRRHNDKSNKHK